jgi:hypothetical protein
MTHNLPLDEYIANISKSIKVELIKAIKLQEFILGRRKEKASIGPREYQIE